MIWLFLGFFFFTSCRSSRFCRVTGGVSSLACNLVTFGATVPNVSGEKSVALQIKCTWFFTECLSESLQQLCAHAWKNVHGLVHMTVTHLKIGGYEGKRDCTVGSNAQQPTGFSFCLLFLSHAVRGIKESGHQGFPKTKQRAGQPLARVCLLKTRDAEWATWMLRLRGKWLAA